MPNDKWVERWAIRSSSGVGDYIIGKDAEGNYGCSCIGWTSHVYCPSCGSGMRKHYLNCPKCGEDVRANPPVRHDCSHIIEVKAGRGNSLGQAMLNRMLRD